MLRDIAVRNAANLRTTGREAAAGRTFDETAIAKLAKGAKFDKATVDSLRATAKAAAFAACGTDADLRRIVRDNLDEILVGSSASRPVRASATSTGPSSRSRTTSAACRPSSGRSSPARSSRPPSGSWCSGPCS